MADMTTTTTITCTRITNIISSTSTTHTCSITSHSIGHVPRNPQFRMFQAAGKDCLRCQKTAKVQAMQRRQSFPCLSSMWSQKSTVGSVVLTTCAGASGQCRATTSDNN
mmetsp:Transcript_44104/g.71481  ORF Transcript_44104/g.71481 Transcript_44104/m.71481 type:complete len:109 (+) Transcript_44104:483-809(+)